MYDLKKKKRVQVVLLKLKIGKIHQYKYKYIKKSKERWITAANNNSCSLSWLVGWFLWHINVCRLFNAKSIFMQIVLYTNKSVYYEYTV